MIFYSGQEKQSFHYLKVFVALVLIGLIAGSISCTAPTGSTSGSGSGTGTGWTVTVSAFPPSISSSNAETSGILVIVKDGAGSPASKGTSVCVAAQRGGFAASTEGGTIPISVCESTNNDIGQIQIAYLPLKTWKVEISPGVFEQMNLPIGPGPDTISATAMGFSGSKTIQIID
jgi:hypothetical protein